MAISTVDQNAKGLKGSRGRVEFGAGGALEGEIAGLADEGHQFLRRRDRPELSATNDQPGDLRGVGFVAEFQKRGRQFRFAHAMEQLRRRLAARSIHSHVQRAGPAIGKPALRIVDLRAGHAQIGEHGIDFLQAEFLQHRGQGREIVVNQIEVTADFFQSGAGQRDVGRVKVDADDSPG